MYQKQGILHLCWWTLQESGRFKLRRTGEFIIFDTQFLVWNTKFIIFTSRPHGPAAFWMILNTKNTHKNRSRASKAMARKLVRQHHRIRVRVLMLSALYIYTCRRLIDLSRMIAGTTAAISSFIDPSLSWTDIEWIMSITNMDVILKGIQTGAWVKNEELWIRNEELCIKNEELCIKNVELCIKNVDFCIENVEFCIQNVEFCIQNVEFCIQNDGLCRDAVMAKKMGVKWERPQAIPCTMWFWPGTFWPDSAGSSSHYDQITMCLCWQAVDITGVSLSQTMAGARSIQLAQA